MQRIVNTLEPIKRSRGLHNEWQTMAYDYYIKLELTRQQLPGLFQFFKLNYPTYPQLIHSAFSFVSDYCGEVPKLKLFYWKFSQLKKAGSSTL